MIRGKTNSYNQLYQNGYPSKSIYTSIDALLGYVMDSNMKKHFCLEMTPATSDTKRYKNNEGCQSKKMYTTNDTPMGSNTKTSVNTNKTKRMTIAHEMNSRSKLLSQ